MPELIDVANKQLNRVDTVRRILQKSPISMEEQLELAQMLNTSGIVLKELISERITT